jgi:hypothetical protein
MFTKDNKNFGIELIKFYKEFLLGTAKSVKILADIEKKYPDSYKIIRELKDDPKAIIELSDSIPDDVKMVLFSIFVEASTLGQRMNRLFDLSKKEKEELSKDLEKFSDKVEKELDKLIKNAESKRTKGSVN